MYNDFRFYHKQGLIYNMVEVDHGRDVIQQGGISNGHGTLMRRNRRARRTADIDFIENARHVFGEAKRTRCLLREKRNDISCWS